MRKIEQGLIDAIKANKPYSNSGTVYTPHGTGGDVYLHGNHIAQYRPDGFPQNKAQKWEFSLAGWNTVTTRGRINLLSREFEGKPAVTTRQGQAYSLREGIKLAITHREWF